MIFKIIMTLSIIYLMGLAIEDPRIVLVGAGIVGIFDVWFGEVINEDS